MARVEHEESDDELVDAMREDGTFAVEGQEQIDIDAETGNSATTDINDVIDGANDDLVNNETSNDAADENTDDDE